ncbi:MAG: hypothetical protein R3F10_03545 [Lysobacteraceae bacterium]
MSSITTPRTSRIQAGGIRVGIERHPLKLVVQVATDRKVPTGLSRGPVVQFELSPTDANLLATHLRHHANMIAVGGA